MTRIQSCLYPFNPCRPWLNWFGKRELFTTSLGVKAGPSRIQVQRIEKYATELQSPKNFFFGVREDATRLPFNVVLFSRTLRRNLIPHRSILFHHHRFVLSINLRTAASVTIDGQSFPFQPGDCSLIFPYQLHAYSNLTSERLCWVFVTFELVESKWLSSLKNRIMRTPPAALDWFEQMIRQWGERQEKAVQLPYFTGLILHELLSAANDSETKPISPGEPQSVSPAVAEPANGLLARVHDLFEGGNRKAKVKDHAQRLGISESYLRSEFRRQTGLKIGHYIREMRINRAASMLVDSSLHISEISARCGFESPFTFSRAFHNIIGVSPRAYRRQFWPKQPAPAKKITQAAHRRDGLENG